jgi:hypothetical protein
MQLLHVLIALDTFEWLVRLRRGMSMQGVTKKVITGEKLAFDHEDEDDFSRPSQSRQQGQTASMSPMAQPQQHFHQQLLQQQLQQQLLLQQQQQQQQMLQQQQQQQQMLLQQNRARSASESTNSTAAQESLQMIQIQHLKEQMELKSKLHEQALEIQQLKHQIVLQQEQLRQQQVLLQGIPHHHHVPSPIRPSTAPTSGTIEDLDWDWLDACAYFYKNMNRNECELLLSNQVCGAHLLRQQGSDLLLSISLGIRVVHIKIVPLVTGEVACMGGQRFASIGAVIDHYSHNPYTTLADGTRIMLTSPFIRR